mmetsp:Transcript_145/g.322  ORF Transcript_145/g.322 Transcript_145/m.322 type:complete len:435 (-) Transcript_145:62-1366(-)
MAAEGEGPVKQSDEAAQDRTVRRVDPLVLLRECTIAGKKVRYADDYLSLDAYQVHKETKCAFRMSPSEPFLDIGSVWYMFHEISKDGKYTKETAKKRGFTYIGVTSRGDLCDYLTGAKPSCPGIVQEVLESRKRPREETKGKTPLAPRLKKAPGPIAVEQDASAPSAPSSSRPGELCYEDVLQRVRPVKELDVIARIPGRAVPNADLILKIAREEVDNWHREPKPALEAGKVVVPLWGELEEMLSKDPEALPIILVPCNKSAPVNILNAQRLLQDGRYHRPDETESLYFESERTESAEVARTMNGKIWTFQVRDSVKGFTKRDWHRVVAVITDGYEWQFKGWPFASIVDLFTTMKGVYFQSVDKNSNLPTHVEKWAVSILKMAPVQFQHRFGAVRDAFWVEVEGFMNSQRRKKFDGNRKLDGGKQIITMKKPIL